MCQALIYSLFKKTHFKKNELIAKIIVDNQFNKCKGCEKNKGKIMESFENSRVGDKIFYDSNSTIGISKIKRLTKTQIILTNEQRFRKKDGRSVGCDIWSTTTIRVLTPARIERVALMKLKNEATWLRNNFVIPLDREALEKLIKALKPFIKEDP